MNAQEQRIAIAKVCGLKVPNMNLNCDPENQCWPDCVEGFSESLNELPDYLNDLNACHEFEKVVATKKLQYGIALSKVIESHRSIPEDVNFFNLIHATAAQRSEAFLKTLSLWKE